ncbi:MAG: hypothetical protein IJH63_05230 [Methanobrevibacter sp.]|nr:hypothetical protein [Methanobrevibacter sp.]MBR0370110.1 hypothetical protein [Methanobrevibacter sp.]
MLTKLGKKGKSENSSSRYAMDFMREFKADDFDAMSEVVENWLKDFPEDANAYYARGVFIGVLIKTRNIGWDDGIKEMDLIADKVQKFEPEDTVLERFYEQLFAKYYSDIAVK